MIKLSKVSKLDGIKSWSLQAFETCPGARAESGDAVDPCRGCYARFGFYAFPDAKAARAFNKEDWKRTEWVDEMVHALSKQSHFRWFDSGDMYSLKLADKIYQVMKRTPHCRHWLPTRMAKFSKFQSVIRAMQALPNVMVRFSSDSVMGEYGPEHGSTILPDQTVPAGVVRCDAYSRGGKCAGCRACWDKSIPVIGYVQHGKSMNKVIRLIKEAA